MNSLISSETTSWGFPVAKKPTYEELELIVKKLEKESRKRKGMERALQESQEFLARVTDSVPEMVYLFRLTADGKMDFGFVSRSAQNIFEYDAEQLQKDFSLAWNLVLPEDSGELQASISESASTMRPWNHEFRIRTPGGVLKWIRGFSLPQGRLKDGTVTWIGTLTDITERKRAEEALQESEARYRLLAEKASDIIFTMNAELRFTYISPGVTRMRGWSVEEAMAQTPAEALTPASLERAMNALENVLGTISGGEKGLLKDTVLELEETCKDGSTIWTETTFTPFLNSDGKFAGFLGITRDISQRKGDEEEKERLQSQLIQAQKMESVGRLAGGVAHDFNNMLQAILGHTELALGQVNSGQPLFDDLQQIRKASERSADLVRQLLAFARKQTISPRVLDLNDTVEGMLKMLRRLIREDIDVAWLPGRGVWPVKMDPGQIDQLLANLVVNARDAIAGVGKVTIETGNVRLDEGYCREYVGFLPGEYVLLAVSDNGVGMGKDILEHVFEPFFTTKEAGKGTGLGLATVYGIVKQNEGFINVYSEPGKGTTIKIYLPPYKARAERVHREEEGEVLARGHETILLVEDAPAILDLTKTLLESLGYMVVAARTPGEAIRLAGEHGREIHLLMTDVVMPEMNGRDLAGNLMSLYPAMKCLFMSGYTANMIAHHGVLDEGVHFLQKPFSMKDLASKVCEALE